MRRPLVVLACGLMLAAATQQPSFADTVPSQAAQAPTASVGATTAAVTLLSQQSTLGLVDAPTALQLRQKLDKISGALLAGKQTVANNELRSFSNVVAAHSGKGLAAVAADALEATVRAVASAPIAVNPATLTVVNTVAGGTPVTLTLPAGNGITQVVVSTAPAMNAGTGTTSLAAVTIDATDSAGQPVHLLNVPVTISLAVAQAQVRSQVVTWSAAGALEPLPTVISATGLDSYVARATTTHFSDFAVVTGEGVYQYGFETLPDGSPNPYYWTLDGGWNYQYLPDGVTENPYYCPTSGC